MKSKYEYNDVRECFQKKDYILLSSEYKNMHGKLYFKCKRHIDKGVQTTNFEQVLHYKNQCKYCKAENISKREHYKIKKKTYEFKIICEENNWIYKGFTVINNTTYILYVCKNHTDIGIQRIRIDHLLNGVKCPYCNISKGESRIEKFLINNDIEYKREYSFCDCKNKGRLRFDFYLPTYNLLIEYQGKQHYEPIYGMGGTTKYIKQIYNDNIKRNYCINNKIFLLEISYREFENIEIIIETMLKTVETTGS